MRGACWQARVECAGTVVGAGFLVTPSTVLTCAHVVQWGEPGTLTVSFPNRPEFTGMPATVTVHGGWTGGTDPGDLAVLELDRKLPLSPAQFASPDAESGLTGQELEAYGFPDGYYEGQLARYRAVSSTRIAGQWVQLEAVTAHGQPVTEGFSGSAAALPDGRVVGMIAQRAAEPGVLVARMLPTETLARYWPGLGELVPARDDGEDPTRRLYELVRRAETAGLECSPDQLFVDAVGAFGPEPPPGGFASLRDAVTYVQWEVVPPAPALSRFAGRLAELLDGPATPTAPAAAPAGAWTPILVEIDRSGAGTDQVTVSVSAYREGRRRPVGTARLTHSQMQEYVQQGIDRAFTRLAPDAEELLTFVLPRDWLNLPVAQWACSAQDTTPLGCAHPVVVTDRYRHHSGRLRHKLGKNWQRLADGSAAALHRVDCGTPEQPPGLRRRLSESGAGVAGFAAPPSALPGHFDVGLNMPVPVLLWPRSGCSDAAGPHPAPCTGSAFLDALAPAVEDVPAAELPRVITSLREEAEAAPEPDRHWARDVQLLWDDPRCFPETAASLHSPVA